MFTGKQVRTVGTVADNLCSDLVDCIITHKPTQLTNQLKTHFTYDCYNDKQMCVTIDSTRGKYVKVECE